MFTSRNHVLSALPLAIAFALGCAAPAEAQWFVRANGPDVFGNTTVVAGTADGSGNDIVVQCDQNSLYIAFISPATASEMDELSNLSSGIPSTMYLKVDQQHVQKFDAELRQWNNTMAGVVASGRTQVMVAELSAIGAGTDTLDVGVDVFGSRQSDSFSLAGSTNAMNTAIKDCKLDAVTATPAQQPSQP